jgi:hypothetical protein
MTEAAAYRAAGQAVAASLEGARLARICIAGVEVAWPDGPADERPRAEVLSDIAIGMAGIAAEHGYRFGRVPGGGCLVSNRFTVDQIEDFAEVRELVDEIDPTGEVDVLFGAWRQAVNLVADPASWSAIEKIADEIEDRGELSGDEIARILNAWRKLVGFAGESRRAI